MDRDALFALVVDERLRLCDQLDAVEPEVWDRPSLCAGWRVRDVLAHLVTLQDIPTRRFVIGTVGLKGFHRRADRFAREYGQRTPADLLARYRLLARSRRTPPVIGPIAPLTDIVVHDLDIARPLGLAPACSDQAVRTVLDALSRGLPGFTPRRLVRDLRFEATDRPWTGGPGDQLVSGPATDLVLALSRRPAGAEPLHGPGAATLRSRLDAH